MPIGWPEIDGFMRRSGFALAPWEIEVIEELDDLYMKVHGEAARDARRTTDKTDK